MCSDKIISEINAGKRIPVRKSILYIVGLVISSGIIGWLFTVIFWISGTTNSIANNTEEIFETKAQVEKLSDNTDELIFNLARLLEINGLDWRSLNK